MKARAVPFSPPAGSARYWTSDLGGVPGATTLRTPTYPEAIDLMLTLMVEPVRGLGAFVGLCWAHRALEFDAPRPTVSGRDEAHEATIRAYAAFGNAVFDELQEMGCDWNGIKTAAQECAKRTAAMMQAMIPAAKTDEQEPSSGEATTASRGASELTASPSNTPCLSSADDPSPSTT